jgi:hypothetical protein
MDHGGSAGRSFRSFKRGPAVRSRSSAKGQIRARPRRRDQAGPAVVLAADARLASDDGEQLFEMFVVVGIIFAG